MERRDFLKSIFGCVAGFAAAVAISGPPEDEFWVDLDELEEVLDVGVEIEQPDLDLAFKPGQLLVRPSQLLVPEAMIETAIQLSSGNVLDHSHGLLPGGSHDHGP